MYDSSKNNNNEIYNLSVPVSPLKTPLHHNMTRGGGLYIKDESKQIGGSFKFRGPFNFLQKTEKPSRVVTASTGNHAIGVSFAAGSYGIEAHIYLPINTPEAKKTAISKAGGIIHLVDGGYEDALACAVDHAKHSDDLLLPSYDHPLIIEGNHNLFLEAIVQADTQFDCVCVPVGGGGCVSAAIEVFSNTNTRIIAAEYQPFERIKTISIDGAVDAIASDHTPEPSTEGIAIKTLGTLNRRIIASCRNIEIVQISYDELVTTCRYLFENYNIVAELGACAGVAAALKNSTNCGTQLCVVTGGNISPVLHKENVEIKK